MKSLPPLLSLTSKLIGDRARVVFSGTIAGRTHSPSEDVPDIRQVHLERVFFLVHAGRHGLEQPRLAQLLDG